MSQATRSVSESTTNPNSEAAIQSNQFDIAESETTITFQPSHIWTYFKRLTHKNYNQCYFITGNGKVCGKELACDKKSSTKSMSNHLLSQHNMSNDSTLLNQSNIVSALKKVKSIHPVSLEFPFYPIFKAHDYDFDF